MNIMRDHNSQKVSIQLPLGGHSFSRNQFPLCDNVSAVEVMVYTYRSTLVPEEVLRVSDAVACLNAVDKHIIAGECVVCSKAVDGAVAVMAVNAECHRALCDMYGDRIEYTSPLLPCSAKDEVLLSLVGDALYVSIYGDKLLFSEVLEASCEADMVYVLECVNEVYHIYNMRARVSGDVERLKKLCNKRFKSVVCE